MRSDYLCLKIGIILYVMKTFTIEISGQLKCLILNLFEEIRVCPSDILEPNKFHKLPSEFKNIKDLFLFKRKLEPYLLDKRLYHLEEFL